MRRLLTALLTCGVVAAGLSAVAEPAPASAAGDRLRLVEGRTIPGIPGMTVHSWATGAGVLWAGWAPDASRDVTLYRTELDGTGEWEPWIPPGASEPFKGGFAQVEGDAVIVTGDLPEGARRAVLTGDSYRPVPSGSWLAPGGRYVWRRTPAGLEITTPESGEPVRVAPGDGGSPGVLSPMVSGERIWSVEDGAIRGRLVKGEGPDVISDPLPVIRATGGACAASHFVVRGRWAVVTCEGISDRRLLVDLSGTLRAEMIEQVYGRSSAVALQTAGTILDPVTLQSVYNAETRGRLDQGGEPVVTSVNSASAITVRHLEGLGGSGLGDEVAPTLKTSEPEVVYADPSKPTSSVPVRVHADDPAARFDLRVDGVEIPGVGHGEESVALSTRRRPCFDVRARDRAGNASSWVTKCAIWDLLAPRYVGARLSGGPWIHGRHVEIGVEQTFTDESRVPPYVTYRASSGTRTGAMGPWGPTTDDTRWPQRLSGTRWCRQAKATDYFNRVSAWSAPACVTNPFDDRSMRGAGEDVWSGRANALDAHYRRLSSGDYAYLPQRLSGRVLVARVRKGPTRGVAELSVGGRPVARYNLRAPQEGWRWITYIAPRAFDTTVGVRSVRGVVLVDAIGISRPGDLYPPRQ